MAPAGTPEPVVARLHAEVARLLQAPDTRGALEAQGAKPIGGTPAELAAVIARDTVRWGKVVRDSGIKAQ
jgi:tripartite-type tricarboxylate transporter receptor subunit TctC